MSDDLVKHLRDLGEHVLFEPHMHHVAADRIEELEAENQMFKNSGIIEVAAQNNRVTEYMFHWEGRALEAEAKVEVLEAENKRLNEQMDSIEEMGTESLNALPDCLMRLAPALVENNDLKVKQAKAVAFIEDLIGCEWPYNAQAERILAELKGEADG